MHVAVLLIACTTVTAGGRECSSNETVARMDVTFGSCVDGSASAIASASGSYPCISNSNTSANGQDSQSGCGAFAIASADPAPNAAKRASASAQVGGSFTEIRMRTADGDLGGCCGVGLASAAAVAIMQVSPGSRITISGDFPIGVIVSPPDQRRVQAMVLLLDGNLEACEYVISSPNGCLLSGAVVGSCQTASISPFQIVTPPTGTPIFVMRAFDFADHDLDLTGDGRFSQADVDSLEALIGSIDPAVLAAFDISGNGTIDQPDVDAFQGLIDCALGSGVFGDVNGNDLIDCNDWDAADPWPTTSVGLGQSNYVVELDVDLNGILDSSDRIAFEALFAGVPNPCSCPGDVNRDGSVGLPDLNIILSNFGTTVQPFTDGDLDGDGSVNLADLTIWQFNAGNSC